MEESSLDAWFEGIAFYRSPERSISYYNKGEILGILLDLRIRQLTNGAKSLRDLFQWMNQHYAKQHRFFPDSAGVEEAAEAITGQSFSDFFRDYVAGVKEIPYDDFVQFAGLHVVVNTTQYATAGFTTTANLGGQPEVVQIDPNSDAQRLGILVGDRVTAVNGKPADAHLDDELSRMQPGTTIRLATGEPARKARSGIAARRSPGRIVRIAGPRHRYARTANTSHGVDSWRRRSRGALIDPGGCPVVLLGHISSSWLVRRSCSMPQ